MKKLIFGCAALASAIALASTVESSNIFGVLKIVSDQEQVIISVPWVTVGSTSGETISPTDLVCTTGLSVGDKLYYYDSTEKKYYGWKVKNTGTPEAPVLTWATDTIAEEGESDFYRASGDETVARGTGALILVRTGTLTSTSAIYLNGQYKESTSTPVTSTISLGATTKWSFFAPTTAEAVALNKAGDSIVANDAIYATGSAYPISGDVIRIAGDKEFKYNGTCWAYTRNVETTVWDPRKQENVTVYNPVTTTAVADVVIPAGVAAIYVSQPRDGENPGSIVYKWVK